MLVLVLEVPGLAALALVRERQELRPEVERCAPQHAQRVDRHCFRCLREEFRWQFCYVCLSRCPRELSFVKNNAVAVDDLFGLWVPEHPAATI